MDDELPQSQRYSIRAVQRVCDIFDLIQEEPEGLTLRQLADGAKFPLSSTYRFLCTLLERRYVLKDPATGLFRIGPAFLPAQDDRLIALSDRLRPHMTRLRDQFEETVNLGVLVGCHVSYVEVVESPHSVRQAARVGDRDELHCTALGKVIGASLHADEVQAILQLEGLPRRTPRTITTEEDYGAELEKVRVQGYALDDCENDDDGRCVAVALRGVTPHAAISISAPASRFALDDVPEYAEALQATVQSFTERKSQ
ncbi:helix-turn-helix domain-containing protein [Phytoactinopolyspora sp. XMNu-373]|uniref:Helix-turn-helix domain-containing protein n=2 Tax=Phytoactinopolyspora mesophila TaxID=2650750 RepID=A0A7K3M022_9ACTN|nr:helix-turn-helix domain-containing protein [Phytoactinopolyspora mesophila]